MLQLSHTTTSGPQVHNTDVSSRYYSAPTMSEAHMTQLLKMFLHCNILFLLQNEKIYIFGIKFKLHLVEIKFHILVM